MSDLRPGEIAHHPEHGMGLVARHLTNGRTIIVHHPHGDVASGYDETHDLDGWELAEIVKPGFVQVGLSGVTAKDARAWIHREHTPMGTVMLSRISAVLADRLLTALDLTPPAARYAGQVTDADGTTQSISHLDQREH